ncbi:hypothetical protein SDC9_112520 [bioreactor metagenome]|uniref:Uncharacterized protein n=1 Tax=bioreactor metagenome TaxID=1076179 RepID=A0A645BQW8_9ZZZZ
MQCCMNCNNTGIGLLHFQTFCKIRINVHARKIFCIDITGGEITRLFCKLCEDVPGNFINNGFQMNTRIFQNIQRVGHSHEPETN